MPRTSFVLPVRDAIDTLPQAVASIRAQTERDWDLIVVDDGSADGTPEWLDEQAEADPRLRVIHQPPSGLVAALNRGLGASDSELVARMDADDILEPRRLERQLELLATDRHLGVVDGQVALFRDHGPVPGGMLRYARWINDVCAPADFDRELLVESPVIHPAATIRRSALEQVGQYRDGAFPEDYDLWLRLHAAGWRLAKVPEVVIRMRDRPMRLTRTDDRYGPTGFRQVRQGWLRATVLSTPRRVALWGAGKTGRPWLRWLLSQGHDVPCIVDVDPRKIGNVRQGSVPIVPPDALARVEAEVCLVAVGARGARPLIRAALGELRPDWVEGVHWWAVQ